MTSAAELPKPTNDVSQGLQDLKRFGYCIHMLLSAGETATILSRLEEQAFCERKTGVAYLGNGGRGGNTWVGYPREGDTAPWQCVRTLLNKGHVFVDLAMNPVVREYQMHLFRGLGFYLSGINGLILRKGAVPMVIHTDQSYVPFTTPLPLVSNVMVCLSDFHAANGGTRVMPASHERPPPKVAIDAQQMDAFNPEPIAGMITPECPAGAAIILDGRLWHSSGWHSADEPRSSISLYYTLPFMRQQDVYAASMHDSVYDQLTDDERAMFGFMTGPPLGRIDPRFRNDRSNVENNCPFIPKLVAEELSD